MSFLDYIASERFIHDDILKVLERSLTRTLRESWAENGRIEPFILSWPSEHIRCDDGTTVTHVFHADLPEDSSTWSRWLQATVEKTKPYALLLGEQKGDEIMVTFESPHGSRSWRYPIRRHGDVRVIGQPSTRDDVDAIGILWKAGRAKA